MPLDNIQARNPLPFLMPREVDLPAAGDQWVPQFALHGMVPREKRIWSLVRSGEKIHVPLWQTRLKGDLLDAAHKGSALTAMALECWFEDNPRRLPSGMAIVMGEKGGSLYAGAILVTPPTPKNH